MISPLQQATSKFEHWLCDDCLPFWAGSGTDLAHGGFFERVSADGTPLAEPRRVRVVARQVYVFATALRHGWIDCAADRLQHGLDFLLGRMQLPSGMFAASVEPDGRVVNSGFDLYEHAFVLFALGAACRAQPSRRDLPVVASALIERLRDGWGHRLGGFHESNPPRAPLLSNPHMHLLEAALEWAELAETTFNHMMPAPGQPRVQQQAEALADELAELCLGRFIDRGTGALYEQFDLDWNPENRRVVEPGHQFEWAWLLVRWGLRHGRPDAVAAAQKLASIGETAGIDRRRGVAVNQLDAELKVIDGDAKLWPQTERIKACSVMADLAVDPTVARVAEQRVVDSIEGLFKYIEGAPRGRWHEVWKRDGSFSKEPTRASSLYHVVCAMETLASALPGHP